MEFLENNEFLPLRDLVFKTLRIAILKGELQPGQRLMEIALANKLGVSRTPIREAIRKLELEGLVTMVPRKGAQVAGITEKNLRDVLEVRRALEELAIELACTRIDDNGIKELEDALEVFKSSVKSKNPTSIAKADEKLHDIIFEHTDNEKLILMLNNLRDQMYRYRFEHVKDEANWQALLEEHINICDAIKSKHITKAKLIIGSHIENQEIIISRQIKPKE